MKHKRAEKIKRLCAEQFNKCAYCDVEMTMDLGYSHTATIDHVVPRHAGGEKKHFNEVASCSGCNTLKGGMPIGDWLRVLVERRLHERFREATANDNTEVRRGQEAFRIVGYPESANPT
jgi:5-methylcytosine-specific restriction endonuclease McrA